MTLTLRRMSAGAAIVFALLAAATLLLGNQRQADAAVRTGAQINCQEVYPPLNENGRPLPHFPGLCQNPPPTPPQCSDGVDNDADGQIDFPADTGCTSATDTTEAPNPPPPSTPTPACSNGTDDDGDSFSDANDPNCHSDGNPSNASSYTPNATSEAGTLPACWNNVDDDGDGVKDFPADVGCTSATDTNETNTAPPPATNPQCSDGVDNDADTLVDSADPGCHTDFNASNASSYNPALNNEAATALPACSDGIDNDSDGLIDTADPGCNNASDTDETNAPVTPPSTGGGSSGGGGGGTTNLFVQGPAGFVGSVLGAATPPPVKVGESCDQYLTAFIKSGGNNDPAQVTRLQYVLREFEGASNVQLNGVYDAATLVAVHAFQAKYASEVLTPWGISKSTGFTYLTTRKKVNEVYCRGTKQFPLTPSEQQTVERGRTGAVFAPTSLSPNISVPTTSTTSGGEGSTDGTGTFWDRVLDIFR